MKAVFWYNKVMKKLIIAIIIIIIVAGIGYRFYQLTVSSKKLTETGQINENKTADWKTYVSEKYGYEIKYPSNWSFYTNVPEYIGFMGQEIAPNTIDISIFPNSSQLPLKNWWDIAGLGPNRQDTLMEDITLVGKPAIKIEGTAGAPTATPFRSVLVAINNTTILQISTSLISAKDKGDYFKQMLSTFKFLQ